MGHDRCGSVGPGSKESKYVTFYLITPEDELFFGQLFKSKKEIALEEYQNALQHVPDSEVYPLIPPNVTLTTAPPDLDDVSAYIKRPGLISYETFKGTDFVPKSVLEETLIMEQISKTPHPHIIRYHGCRVHRGRITGIVFEQLDKTLAQYVFEPEFAHLDKAKFTEALESAIAYLHQLGLAHNDINPHNIMVRDGLPFLIDFGSCAPYGGRLQSLGSPGWYEELFYTSEAKHDVFALNKMREWLDKPE
ncbi:kinase-like domain-containing protein [Immersiella caudata]|uniref:Kinase-like domain-containing protein n=1 Tax=Immersiella caudata TaxID=314043 RepID=A0AA39WSV3_9PEZI|nr:kinase-like domain-containing protein [Immersiella caudata]